MNFISDHVFLTEGSLGSKISNHFYEANSFYISHIVSLTYLTARSNLIKIAYCAIRCQVSKYRTVGPLDYI